MSKPPWVCEQQILIALHFAVSEKSARLEQLNRELEVGQADEVIMNESEDEVQDAPVKAEEISKSAPKPRR